MFDSRTIRLIHHFRQRARSPKADRPTLLSQLRAYSSECRSDVPVFAVKHQVTHPFEESLATDSDFEWEVRNAWDGFWPQADTDCRPEDFSRAVQAIKAWERA